jgi:hypothetical protein
MTPEIRLTEARAHLRHGSNIGQPISRRDAILKVTGRAPYAADHRPPGMLYAVLAVSSGRGAHIALAFARKQKAGDNPCRARAHDAGMGIVVAAAFHQCEVLGRAQSLAENAPATRPATPGLRVGSCGLSW